MARASYKSAITWLVNNDDNEWLRDARYGSVSVTAALVADLWGKDDNTVAQDLLRELQHIHPNTWYGVTWNRKA